MKHVLVRYAEIGTKSRRVMGRMVNRLSDRVRERVGYEAVPVESVETVSGRVVVETERPRDVAEAVAELPGVASSSPAVLVDPTIEAVGEASDRFPIDGTFGVDANTATDVPFTSQDVNEAVGARVQERTGAAVDLDDPDTWIEVDVREEGAYVFVERFEGPGGFPVGSQAPLAALVSGGIDSPVAAYEAMTRGADVVPIYFYNKPIAAGDHVLRFEEALSNLRRIHPAKDWYYHRVDMEAANEALLDIEEGRMLLHRAVLFRVAERIAEDEGLSGLVTGEAIGQKSSQTVRNLSLTTRQVELPVFRPLLTRTKEEIVERARTLGTFEAATIDSACRTLAPDAPATRMATDRFEAIAADVGVDDLVDRAYDDTERIELPE